MRTRDTWEGQAETQVSWQALVMAATQDTLMMEASWQEAWSLIKAVTRPFYTLMRQASWQSLIMAAIRVTLMREASWQVAATRGQAIQVGLFDGWRQHGVVGRRFKFFIVLITTFVYQDEIKNAGGRRTPVVSPALQGTEVGVGAWPKTEMTSSQRTVRRG